jgi:hypothetical protein
MFEIKKISITAVNHFEKASEAVKIAEEATKADAFEIRATTDKGDLQLTIDDLKKIAEGESKEDEDTPAQPVE